jgi:hypothetical protein
MTTGTKAAALVAMIRNLDGDFIAQCQLVEDALKQERDRCANRAEYGDCETGMGCHQGYHPNSPTGVARKQAADDIRKLNETDR